MQSSQPAKNGRKGEICRVCATSFYESVTLWQAAAKCIDGGRTLPALDFEIKAFNERPATRRGG
jgi:hypothetical protein